MIKLKRWSSKITKVALLEGYETVEDFLGDASRTVQILVNDQVIGSISDDDGRQALIDADGDIEQAVLGYTEDLDRSDPTKEAHYSWSWLNR